jgi:hypothetical protein
MNLPARRSPWCVGEPVVHRLLAVPALLIGLASLAAGQQAREPDPIMIAARAAAADKSVTKSKLLGFGISDKPFDELPAVGAVLVGFDVGLEKDSETVAALRPIYRTASGETFFKEYGLFHNRGSGKGMIKTRVGRSVRVSASSGYAVGSITVRTGLGLNALSLRYMRITGAKLDKSQAYNSNWVGSERGGEHTIGDGAPIIGVFGNENDSAVIALGVYSMKAAPSPVAMPKPEPEPVIPPRPPTAKNPPVEAKPEIIRPTQPAATAKPSEPELATVAPAVADEDEELGQLPAWVLLSMLAMVLIPGIVGLAVIFGRRSVGLTKPPVAAEEEPEKSPFDLDELRGLAGLSPLGAENGIQTRPNRPSEAKRPDAPNSVPQRGEEPRSR